MSISIMSRAAFATALVALMCVVAVAASDSAKAQSGQAAVAEAQSWLGTPYVYGGASRGGVDCSGLTQRVYQSLGVNLPRTTNSQFYATAPSWGYGASAGDLVFSNYGNGWASHVGISTGDGNIINAPYPGTVVRYDPIRWGYVNGVRSAV